MNFLNFFISYFLKIRVDKIRSYYENLCQETKYIEVIKKSKQIKPIYKEKILDIVGYAYFQLGEYKKAQKYLSLSLKNICNPFYTNYFLAFCYFKLDNLEKSILFFIKCLNLKDTNINKVLNDLLPILNELKTNKQKNRIHKAISDLILFQQLSSQSIYFVLNPKALQYFLRL